MACVVQRRWHRCPSDRNVAGIGGCLAIGTPLGVLPVDDLLSGYRRARLKDRTPAPPQPNPAPPEQQCRGASVASAVAGRGGVNGQWDLPTGGQQNCPLVASGTARWRTAELPTVQLVSGVTPFPAVAWVRRMLSPAVSTMWAWCMSRSTVALAMVLGMSSSNPAGWRLLDRAMERFS